MGIIIWFLKSRLKCTLPFVYLNITQNNNPDGGAQAVKVNKQTRFYWKLRIHASFSASVYRSKRPVIYFKQTYADICLAFFKQNQFQIIFEMIWNCS